jgi:hypothetical protein
MTRCHPNGSFDISIIRKVHFDFDRPISKDFHFSPSLSARFSFQIARSLSTSILLDKLELSD